jgi:hypothetical protein
MPEILTFEQALDSAASQSKRHVLLGNGFSRACRDDIFAYGKLFDRANFDSLSPTAKRAFEVLDTTDFEVVMRALRNAAKLVPVYAAKKPEIARALRTDADGLRDVLARTIADSHPERPSSISEDEYRHCRDFLGHFDNIYTLNYDLLLYWALMQEELDPIIKFDDGFRQPEDGPELYVTWGVENTRTQNLFYLHGALHVFDAGAEIQKFTWKQTDKALIDQIREALNTNRFPLIVAEGTSTEKLARIQHSGFLNRAFRSFSSIGGALFVYGHSMAENDEHIVHLAERGNTKLLLVGLYGNPSSQSNQKIMARVHAMEVARGDRRRLNVRFFDAQSAEVWGYAA